MIHIDAKRLLCPMPVICLGDEITIVASDVGVLHDIPAWCKVPAKKLFRTSKVILLPLLFVK